MSSSENIICAPSKRGADQCELAVAAKLMVACQFHQRSYGDFEGVIFARWLQQSLDLRTPHDLEPSLSSQELPPISPLDYPVCCAPTPAGGLVAGAHTRHPVRLEGARTRRHRCAGNVQRCHHAYAFVPRLHIWVPPCSNSGRQ